MFCSVLVLTHLVSLSPALLFLLLPDWSVTQEAFWENKSGHECFHLHGKEHNCTWRCMVFTMQWPGGFCQSLYNESHCKIPPSVNNWTIHGLWPLRDQNCCSCWPMFHSDVQELQEELTEHWPSLLRTRHSFEFWRDEWRKHGACAACVEGFNSPFKYFQISLKLRQQFDINRLLDEAGVSPSCERTYEVTEVSRVLTPHLGDKHEIQCVRDQKDREVLFQVKVRLTRNLTVGCDHHGDADGGPAAGPGPGPGLSSGHPCPPDSPFYYFPIKHQQPWRPCD